MKVKNRLTRRIVIILAYVAAFLFTAYYWTKQFLYKMTEGAKYDTRPVD